MPIYEWECGCGYADLVFAHMDNDQPRMCPRCEQNTLQRLIGSGAGIIFSSGLKDLSGESIWWPKGEKSYFDPAFQRRFDSPEEKKKFMDDHKIVSAGSMDSDNHKLKKTLESCKEQEKEHGKK